MDLAYAAADLVLCRAGASTIAELCVVGVGSILVPYPHAAADEQTANAQALADADAGILVRDADLDGPALARLCAALLSDDARLARMRAAAASLGRPDAAQAVAQIVLDLAERGDRR